MIDENSNDDKVKGVRKIFDIIEDKNFKCNSIANNLALKAGTVLQLF